MRHYCISFIYKCIKLLYLPNILLCPDQVVTRTKAAIGKREGKIDNLTRLEIIRAEEQKIAEEKREKLAALLEAKSKEEAAKKKAEEVGNFNV